MDHIQAFPDQTQRDFNTLDVFERIFKEMPAGKIPFSFEVRIRQNDEYRGQKRRGSNYDENYVLEKGSGWDEKCIKLEQDFGTAPIRITTSRLNTESAQSQIPSLTIRYNKDHSRNGYNRFILLLSEEDIRLVLAEIKKNPDSWSRFIDGIDPGILQLSPVEKGVSNIVIEDYLADACSGEELPLKQPT